MKIWTHYGRGRLRKKLFLRRMTERHWRCLGRAVPGRGNVRAWRPRRWFPKGPSVAIRCGAFGWAQARHGITSQRPGTGAVLERGRPRPLRRTDVAATPLSEETGKSDRSLGRVLIGGGEVQNHVSAPGDGRGPGARPSPAAAMYERSGHGACLGKRKS